METLVAKEIAVADVNRWLHAKKISNKKRETYKTTIDQLVDFVEEGVLSLNDDNVFVHTLKFPVGVDTITNKLEYKLRLSVDASIDALKGTNGSGTETVLAYVSALTGQVKGFIKKLDSEDYSVAQAITVFFL
jgi:hypothetical protein